MDWVSQHARGPLTCQFHLLYLTWPSPILLSVEAGICVSVAAVLSPPTIAALQDIATSEAELTRRRVQVSAGGKQADKMTRDAAKTQSDLDKASADMQAKQQDFKVGAFGLKQEPWPHLCHSPHQMQQNHTGLPACLCS